MKSLTLFQPWASLVAAGVKCVETRSWGTSYRGDLAIHASKRWDDGLADAWRDAAENTRRCWGLAFRPPAWIAAGNLPLARTLGCVVAVVTLADCRPMTDAPDAQEALFGTFGTGRWGWTLANLRSLAEPVPVTGRQLLWDLPPAVHAAVLAQVGESLPAPGYLFS
jgi:hypothetical protein